MAESTQAIARLPIAERLARIGWTEVLRVPELGPCWEWKGTRNVQGYGRIQVRGRTQGAHRIALEGSIGLIPDGKHACHRCDNPPCVNPAHLYAGTPSENTVDFYSRSAIQRPKGEDHPMVKLTSAQAAEIRERYAAGGISQRSLGREYGVSYATVARIAHGHSWT